MVDPARTAPEEYARYVSPVRHEKTFNVFAASALPLRVTDTKPGRPQKEAGTVPVIALLGKLRALFTQKLHAQKHQVNPDVVGITNRCAIPSRRPYVTILLVQVTVCHEQGVTLVSHFEGPQFGPLVAR